MPPRPPPNPLRPPLPIVQKIAARYAKTGAARWHSHHDMMRFWERAVRRAGLPIRLTEGFNPKPRLVFPHALGVGVASEDEWVEMELTGARSPRELKDKLAAAVEPSLRLLEVEELPLARKGRVVASCVYRIGGIPASAEELRLAAERMTALESHEVERGPERARARVDVRPYLLGAETAGPGAVRLWLAHTPRGAGRVDEWARWLGAAFGVDGRALDWSKEATRFGEAGEAASGDARPSRPPRRFGKPKNRRPENRQGKDQRPSTPR